MPGHDVSCARRLRAENPGLSLSELAQEIGVCCGHPPLKAHRLAKGWTVEKAVESFHEMCARTGLGARGLTARSWIEWEQEHLPNADYQDLLCRLFHTGPVQLGFARSYGPPSSLPTSRPLDQRVLVTQVAHESLAHAADAQLSDLSTVTLEHIHDEIRRLASEYVYDHPLPLFQRMLQLRRQIFTVLDGRIHPGQGAQVMLFAGQICGLLANASLDLGKPSAAAAQAKAAWTYASIIDHNALRAWVRGLQAMIAYWTGSPRMAGDLARDGQRYALGATSFARLASIEALASAAVGAESDALRALGHAWDQKDIRDEIHDGLGGEFGFDLAKHSYLAASAYIHLGHTDSAIGFALRAITRYQSGPPHLRAYGNEAIAYSELAAGHLLNGDLEAAATVAATISELPEHQRIDGLVRRLDNMRLQVIGEPRFRGCAEARALVERLESFHPWSYPREVTR
ncbi:XRE family transcriptional regulator [Thermopolyspora sp. NPDC052614]|uniref:XRE family transcriptional regulator n=1 Tax=Thermopolyspora sp. NPDC052614 TaxID=3155682 RepID=UPI003441EF60